MSLSVVRVVFSVEFPVDVDVINEERLLIGREPFDFVDEGTAIDYAADCFESKFGFYPSIDEWNAEAF